VDESKPNIFADIFDSSKGSDNLLDVMTNLLYGLESDCTYHIKVSRNELLNGCTKSISYKIRKFCDTCDGTGEADKSIPEQCTTCNGNGYIDKVKQNFLGTFTNIKTCDPCRGTGVHIKNPCVICKGSRVLEVLEHQEIFIAPNSTAHTITIDDKGNYIDKDKRGNLIVTVSKKRWPN